MNNIASLAQARGDLEAAEAGFREVLAIHAINFGDEHPEIAQTMRNLAFVIDCLLYTSDAADE